MRQVAIPMEELAPLLQQQMAAGGSAVLTVTGYSMMPMLHHRRDTVVLEEVKRPLQKGDIALYRRDNGAYILHRILRKKGDTYICCGDNQLRTEKVEARQLIAVVTEFTRKGRHHTVADKSYRFYQTLWVTLHPLRWLYLIPRRGLGMLRAAIRRARRKKR